MTAKFPRPYFRSQRGTWCVQLRGRQITLGSDRDEAFRLCHRMMAEQGQAPAARKDHEARGLQRRRRINELAY
jgi:hypothetical protein